MKNKKGSHIGMVLSFVIFVTFAVFIAAIIQPTISVRNDKKTTLSYVKNSINQEIVLELTTATLIIENNPPQNCVVFENFLSEAGMDSTIVARSESGKESAYSSSDENSLWISRSSGSEVFFKIYGSSEFSELNAGVGDCTTLTEGVGYSIGLIKTEKQIFESKVLELIEAYGEFDSMGYKALKDELGVPSDSEFSISFTNSDGTKIEANGEEPSISIYIDKSTIQYINSNAEIKTGSLEISVW